MKEIFKHQSIIKNHINKSFVDNPTDEAVGEEYYTRESLVAYTKDLKKAFDNKEITLDEFEKGKKDLSRLAMRQIIDKKGHKRIVYVKVHEDEKGETHETDFNEGDEVKFNKNGKDYVGKIKKLKFHDKTDKFGTAMVEVDGIRSQFSVSLGKLHSTSEKSTTKQEQPKAKQSDSKISAGDYVQIDKNQKDLPISISNHKGKQFKVVGEVDSGLVSQPKFLKVKDVESDEEFELNPSFLTKMSKEESKKEFKSNMKESYPDHNGGKYHKMADSMQDMADKAKNDGEHRRAAIYQKFADQHRAEATEWEAKNTSEDDGGDDDDYRGELKPLNEAFKDTVLYEGSVNDFIDGDVKDNKQLKSHLMNMLGASKMSEIAELSITEAAMEYGEGDKLSDFIPIGDSKFKSVSTESNDYYGHIEKFKVGDSDIHIVGIQNASPWRVYIKKSDFKEMKNIAKSSGKVKKSIDETDIKKAFDKLGHF